MYVPITSRTEAEQITKAWPKLLLLHINYLQMLAKVKGKK